MGKKLDSILGRRFKTSKFKAMAALAISRSAVLKNQRQARCSIARSDVVELLKNGNHERALFRVEQVIKEQNMLDALLVLEAYCHMLIERVNLVEREKVCPEEIKEAVSTLIFASARMGDFPELQEIRSIFASRYGKEFASGAIELWNNCGVNPKIIQKLSTRMPSLETKTKLLKEIAADNNIDLPVEDTVSYAEPENKQEQVSSDFSDSVKMRRKYRDVADAAQAAFESAAYAAAAARAALELSRGDSTDPEETRKREAEKPRLNPREKDDESMKSELQFEKIHPVENHNDENREAEDGTVLKRWLSNSSFEPVEENVNGVGIKSSDIEDGLIKQGNIVYNDEREDEDEKNKHSLDGDQIDYMVEAKRSINKTMEPLNINRRPISVRTKKTQGRSLNIFAPFVLL